MTSWLEAIASSVAEHIPNDSEMERALTILAEGATALQCGVERRVLRRLMTGDPGAVTCSPNKLLLRLEGDLTPSGSDLRFTLRLHSRSGVYVDTLLRATLSAKKIWPVRISLCDDRVRVCHDPTELRRQFIALAEDSQFVGRLIAIAER